MPESVSDGTSKERALLGGSYEAVYKVLVVVAHALVVHLVSLHTGKNDFDWIGSDAKGKTTKQTGHGVGIRSRLSSRVTVDPIIEISEACNSSRGEGHCTEEKSIKCRPKLPEAATCVHDLLSDLHWVIATLPS